MSRRNKTGGLGVSPSGMRPIPTTFDRLHPPSHPPDSNETAVTPEDGNIVPDLNNPSAAKVASPGGTAAVPGWDTVAERYEKQAIFRLVINEPAGVSFT